MERIRWTKLALFIALTFVYKFQGYIVGTAHFQKVPQETR